MTPTFLPTREMHMVEEPKPGFPGLRNMGGGGPAPTPCPPAKRCKVCRARGQADG